MSNIKTRESVKDIKVLDKAAVASERMKTALVRSKDQVENLMDDGQVSPSEYAEDKIRYAAEDVTDQVGHDISCLAHPQLSITFTVKDSTAINEEMLRSATANAKRKAEILCDASGMELGALLSIDYNWGELNVYSNTRYDMEEECLAAPMMAKCAEIDMEPDDIDVSDTATFVWEIK